MDNELDKMFGQSPLEPAPKRPKTYVVESKEKQAKLTKSQIRALEAEVENYLVKRCKECGLDFRKLNPQMCKGIPDRLVFDPKGVEQHQFVELKRDFKAKASPMQVYLARGLQTIFIHSLEEVENFLWFKFPRAYQKPKKPIE